MRPEDRMAMAVVIELLGEAPSLGGAPATCEKIRQAVASEGRTMRQVVAKEAREQALDQARELVALELGGLGQQVPPHTQEDVERVITALGDMAVGR